MLTETQIATINTHLYKGLELVGLSLSELEINELKSGKNVFLENRSLSEIGSLFILASALSISILGESKKIIIFHDLPITHNDSSPCSGVPIYSWNFEDFGKRYLYLTMIDGKPAIRIDY